MHKCATSPPIASEFALPALAQSGNALMGAARRIVTPDEVEPLEAVGELRGAIRRMRADLRTFAPVLERAWLALATTQVRDLARVVGQVRDLDVICCRLEHRVASLSHGDRQFVDALLTEFRLDRRAALRRTVDAMGKPYRRAAIEEFALIEARRPLAAHADRVAVEDLVSVSRRHWRRLRRSARAAEAAPSHETLHRVRSRSRTLRYSLESLGPLLHRSARDHALALAPLQDSLRELQDAIVVERWLRVVHETGRGDAFVVGEIVGLERARTDRVCATWRAQWRHASRPHLLRWTD